MSVSPVASWDFVEAEWFFTDGERDEVLTIHQFIALIKST
jgi:hypothetical protein